MKKVKIGSYKKYIELMYSDRMNIYRLETTKKSSGATSNTIPEDPTYINIPCKISFKPKPDGSNIMGDASNPVNLQIKIFCSPNIDIKKGDKLEIFKMDEDGNLMETYTGNTNNRPAVFVGHKEVLFTQTGDA